MSVRGVVLSLGLLAASASAALADITFSFSNATFSLSPVGSTPAAGTLTGTFTTNNALNALVSYNITASASSPNFLGFNFTSANSIATPTLPLFFQINSTGGSAGRQLQIVFNGALTSSGATLNQVSSYESELGFLRFASGSVVANAVAVPGPIAGAGLPAAFGLFGAWLVRRRRQLAA